jgi:hypothetical protein
MNMACTFEWRQDPSVSSGSILRTVLAAFSLTMGATAHADCSWWKEALCVVPISSCTFTAGWGGRDPLLRCVAAGASWCLDCFYGTGLDPRSKGNENFSDGGGFTCSTDGCGPGKTTLSSQALSSPPVPTTPGVWPKTPASLPAGGVPSVIRDGNKTIAFYRGINSHLWMITRTDASWGPATDLGGGALTSAPSAVLESADKYRVFYAGANGNLWMSSWNGGPWWSAAADLGGVKLNSAPSAVAVAPESYRVFYKGPNDHLWLSSKDPGPWWSAPADLGGVVLGSAPSAVVITGEVGHLGVFYVGPNGHLTMSGWDNGPWWSEPVDLGGGIVKGDPSAVSPLDHEIDVYYAGATLELTHSQWIGGPWWSGAYGRGTLAAGGVAAISNTEAIVRDAQGQLAIASAVPGGGKMPIESRAQELARLQIAVPPSAPPPANRFQMVRPPAAAADTPAQPVRPLPPGATVAPRQRLPLRLTPLRYTR